MVYDKITALARKLYGDKGLMEGYEREFKAVFGKTPKQWYDRDVRLYSNESGRIIRELTPIGIWPNYPFDVVIVKEQMKHRV